MKDSTRDGSGRDCAPKQNKYITLARSVETKPGSYLAGIDAMAGANLEVVVTPRGIVARAEGIPTGWAVAGVLGTAALTALALWLGGRR